MPTEGIIEQHLTANYVKISKVEQNAFRINLYHRQK